MLKNGTSGFCRKPEVMGGGAFAEQLFGATWFLSLEILWHSLNIDLSYIYLSHPPLKPHELLAVLWHMKSINQLYVV